MEEKPSRPYFELRLIERRGSIPPHEQTLFSLLSLVFLTGLAHAQKKASPYPPEVPKPTYSEVPYGKHDRNALDFWKAKSDSPLRWLSSSTEAVGREARRKDFPASPTPTLC